MTKSKANLLVTFDPSHLESAKKEILDLLKDAKEEAKILEIGEGIAEVAVDNAREAIKKLDKIAKKSIEKFSYTMNWVPVDTWCKNTIRDMQKEIKSFVKDIGKDEKWKMELKTRKLKEKPNEVKLILKLTEVVDRKKVDLKKPEKIIKVEIIGNKAGLALLKKKDILNIAKIRK